ncbi:hypothetical protein GGTG_08901 [Gaeumannomyces tritici R3-111a-1]|uniref:Uncharacterized protein n=1 Tax=Gaeumannomyces tritici (strain R3-111a-1) TaxID=644352 RepID=J3P5W1_GAET3|nr:hypothetical protein GGTG_08901 [Gaeumannomyces tritici R3-111a-1]EJT75063.1 hypothetical protein GGTG_08901 [Gaeumannomyces tritici R3-111a-1]
MCLRMAAEAVALTRKWPEMAVRNGHMWQQKAGMAAKSRPGCQKRTGRAEHSPVEDQLASPSSPKLHADPPHKRGDQRGSLGQLVWLLGQTKSPCLPPGRESRQTTTPRARRVDMRWHAAVAPDPAGE